MTREESKYCEGCKHCISIQMQRFEGGKYKVHCQIGNKTHYEAIAYCKKKKLKKEKIKNAK